MSTWAQWQLLMLVSLPSRAELGINSGLLWDSRCRLVDGFEEGGGSHFRDVDQEQGNQNDPPPVIAKSPRINRVNVTC